MKIKRETLYIHSLRLTVDIEAELKGIPFSLGASYSSPEQQLLRVAEGTLLLGAKESLIVQWTPSSQGGKRY